VLLRQEAILSIEKLARRKKKPAAKKFSLAHKHHQDNGK